MSWLLSVVFPVYNEEALLEKNIREAIRSLEALGRPFEIILANDGSSDQTASLAAGLARRDPRIRVVTLETNKGKGGALKAGILESRGDRVLFSDIDLSVPFNTVNIFLDALNNGYDLAIGSRRVPGAAVLVHQPFLRETLGKGFTVLSSLILGLKVSDYTCGFKMIKGAAARDLFYRLTLADWSYDAELLFLSEKLEYRRIEIPVPWSNRPDSRVRLRKDLWNSFWGLIKTRWRHRKVKGPSQRINAGDLGDDEP